MATVVSSQPWSRSQVVKKCNSVTNSTKRSAFSDFNGSAYAKAQFWEI
jgi:hypothetical protein